MCSSLTIYEDIDTLPFEGTSRWSVHYAFLDILLTHLLVDTIAVSWLHPILRARGYITGRVQCILDSYVWVWMSLWTVGFIHNVFGVPGKAPSSLIITIAAMAVHNLATAKPKTEVVGVSWLLILMACQSQCKIVETSCTLPIRVCNLTSSSRASLL